MDFVYDGLQTYLTLIIGFILLAFIYGQWPMFYWTKRNMPGPPPLPLIGNILEFRRHTMTYIRSVPLLTVIEAKRIFHMSFSLNIAARMLWTSAGAHNCFKTWTKQYGRVFGVYLLRKPVLVVTDTEILKEIFVKNFSNFTDKWTMTDRRAHHPLYGKMLPFAKGAEWKRMRHIAAPAFSSAKLKSMECYINDCAARLVKILTEKARQGEQINTLEVYGSYIVDLIAALLFGISLDSMSNKQNPMFQNATTILSNTPIYKAMFTLCGMFPFLNELVSALGITQFPKAKVDFFIENFGKIMDDRRKSDKPVVDFLQLLTNARAEDEEQMQGSKKLNRDEIIANMTMFFIAGYETSVNTFTFMSYHLVKDKELQDRLIAEVDETLGNEIPTSENLSKLKLVDAAITETLRMYPTVAYLTRETASTCLIKGVQFDAGLGVLIPAFAISRDPEFYPDPDTFNPDRFLDESVERNPMTYLPFGVGPRQCVGMRLALIELKITLVHILRKIRFSDTTELQWPQSLNPTLLKTETPVLLRAEARTT